MGGEKGRSGVAMRRSKSDPVGVGPGPSAGAQEGANLLLVVKGMEKDMLVKQPTMQVYIPPTLPYRLIYKLTGAHRFHWQLT